MRAVGLIIKWTTSFAAIVVTLLSTTYSDRTLAAEMAINTALPDLSWAPPEDSFDWIQLKSGEWLKGQIKAMQDRELEFNSEELDEQLIEWKKIRQVRSGVGHVIKSKFISGELLSGRIAITPDQVIITSDGSAAPTLFERDQLQSFTRGGDKERQYWSGNAALGLTIRGGNTEQTDYNGTAHLQRRTPDTRYKFDYIGNKSEAGKIESANNHRASTELDVWMTRHFYLVVPFVEYFRDPFQNVDSRVTAGVGVGYDVIDTKKMEWTISTGPAYQRTQFVSTQPGEADQKESLSLTFNSHFNWDISDPLELTLDYRGQYTSRDVGETMHHAAGTLAIDLTKRIDLDLSVVWDRIANPKVGADGIQTKPDDYRLIVGVKVEF